MTSKQSKAKQEYDKQYNARPEQKKNRAERNAARREMEKSGAVHKGDGKDVDHKKMLDNGGSNARSNLRVVDQKTNRGWRKSNGKTYG